MDHKDLKPVTFQTTLELPEKINLDCWGNILRDYLTMYSIEISKKPGAFIGHIKAFYSGHGESFIKINIYKPDIPADLLIKGEEELSRIMITVNSLVYGVTQEETVTAIDCVTGKLKDKYLVETEYYIKQSGDNNATHCGHHHHE
jgi:hypothetical protein